VSPAEAERLAEVVEAMPKEKRRAVKKRFEKAVKHMEDAGLVDARAARGRSALLSAATTGSARWDDASRRYFEAHIACPFLEDSACIAYAERPMGCREYYVTTPVALCESLDPTIMAVERPVYMSDALTALTNEALGRADAAVPLALALEWASVHGRAMRAVGDGEELAMALVAQIQEQDGAGEAI
jgi:Fe-S-cluster containining protein